MLFQFKLVSTFCKMAENKRQRCIISLFQTISNDEKLQIVERELAQMTESNKDVTSCSVVILALGLQPRQGLIKVWAKREAWESHLMLPGM
jgi:hypothetical protein